MDRRTSLPRGSVGVLIICVIGILLVGVGVTLASAEADGGEPLNITNAGDTEDLFSFESTNTISNIEITRGERTNEYLTLYINFKELQRDNINVSNVGIRNVTISNGEFIETDQFEDDDEIIITIKIESTDSDNPIQVDTVEFDGINTSTGGMTDNLHYRVAAIGNNSTESYEYLRSEEYVKNSTKFKYVDGSITVRDQATTSTNLGRDGRTSSGVTVSRLNSNINSTIVLTDRDNNEIVGYKSRSAKEMDGTGNISLNTSNLGGKYDAYLIPDEMINLDQEDIGTELSDKEKQSAVDKNRFHVYLGTVEFEDQKYELERTTNISVATSEVRDTVGMNTPYIIMIHPLTSDNEIIYQKYIGYSDVLVGVHDDLNIPIRDAKGNKKTIWHSNRYAATIRLAKGQEPGDPVFLNSTKRLPNSDIEDQFVEGDVSDSAIIQISNNLSTGNESVQIDRLFNDSEYNITQSYSGELIGYNNTTSSAESINLYRRTSDNRSVIAGTGNYQSSTGTILFNTTGLETGSYSISQDDFEDEKQFRMIGRSDQRVELTDIDGQKRVGGKVDYKLFHNTSKIKLEIIGSDTTLATANLTTPDPGRTTIGLNTYALGNGSLTDSVVTAGSTATVESVDTSMSNETLPPGTYRVAVRSEQGLATTADEATVTVENRSTNGLTAYATTDLGRDDLGTAEAVRRAIGNGTLSPTSTVTSEDTVVYAANATGLTGLPAARNATIQTGTDLALLDGLAFDVRSNASTTTNGAGESVPANSSVYLDESGLFLVSDGADALATDETPTDGETFTAEFRVEDDRLREAASNSTAGHDASATLTFEAPERGGGGTESEDSLSDDSLSDGDGGSEADDGGTSGGGTGGTGGGSETAGGGGRSETTPTGDAPSSDSTAAGAEVRGDDEARPDLGIIGGRVEVRPAPDVRGVANSESDVSAAVGSVPAVPTRVGDAPPGSDAGAPDDDPVGSGAGSEGTAAGEDEASSADGGDDSSGTTDESATESDTAGTEPPAPSYDDAPIRATAEDVPGFGPVVAVIALLVAGRLAAIRR
ncbi:MAG: PGF-CTERM sorting domain-containing protein [Halorubrum sp.]|uniref:PGF-CTERM sorting domain-containing protein n=1 Tax=Halorubrum sp. TaxID=1879286 RepID=UPI003970668B